MTSEKPTILLMDDDLLMRTTIHHFLSESEFQVATFESTAAFLAFNQSVGFGCIIADLQLPGIDCLASQSQWTAETALPVIFTTETADVASCVRAMRKGAIDVLPRPLRAETLLQSVETALEVDRLRQVKRAEILQLRKHYAQLTPREREVLPLVTAGLLNKQTAAELGTSEITICVHRSQIMRKMAAPSLADLVRMVDKLGVQESPLGQRPPALAAWDAISA